MTTDTIDNGSSAATPATKESPANIDDVSKLSDDDIKWRAKYKHTKDELETLRVQADKEKQELATKFDTTHKEKQSIEKRWVEAEVKAHAIAAGIKDIDLVKLIDTSGLKVGENGIEGLQQAIADFKSKKPDFFGAEKKFSSSTNAPFPTETKVAKVSARDMSDAEWAQAKLQIKTGGMPY